MILEILISTIDSGIYNVRNIILPFRKDVKYLVSHQFRDEKYLKIPTELIRDDIRISQIPGQGLTKSRNNAIKCASGDICIIADDDVKFKNEYLDIIKKKYLERDSDLICFKIYTGSGCQEYKEYPMENITIQSLRDYTPSSIEITFKRTSIINNKIIFDELFGIGSLFSGGEESIFMHDIIKSELKAEFIPEYIVYHPFESTIKSLPKYHSSRVKIVGAVDARCNGWISIPKAFLGTVKNLPDLLKNNKNPLKYCMEWLEAALYILFHPRRK